MSARPPLPSAAASVALDAQIDALATLDLADLRVRWRKLMRTAPPEHLPRFLLIRVLAYKLQARALGDLDPETARYLADVERERVRQRVAGHKRRPKDPPPVPPVPASRGHRPGTLLMREHAGKMHAVTVVADGYAWNGATHKSLSEIARLITGTRWNGPRFFGLREGSLKRAGVVGEGKAS